MKFRNVGELTTAWKLVLSNAYWGCAMKDLALDRRSIPKPERVRTTARRSVAGFTVTAVLLLVAAASGLGGEVYGTFTAVGEMNDARSYHTATLLPNGKVLIAGGRRTYREELDSAELYDPALHKFIPTGKMHWARAGHTATLLPDGRVLIAGGFQPGDALASAELYDPASGSFRPTGRMTVARQWHSATLLPDGKVLIAGGASNQTGITPTAELYDPATGKFVATGSLTVARMLHYAVALDKGAVLIIGGVRGGGPNFLFSGHNFLASAELFDPRLGRFTEVPGTGFGRSTGSNGSAVLLASGKVLIAGGIDGEVIVSSARLYDPATGQFVDARSMGSERFWHEATLLGDGCVLVTGGMKTNQWPGPVVVATAELYDPQRGAFLRLPDMTTPRAAHTATLLPDGQVLIAGGVRGSFIAVSSAELFRPAPAISAHRAGAKNSSGRGRGAIRG